MPVNVAGGTLVLFPGALGDAVCLEPTIDRLARLGPVRLLARGAAAEVAALFPARPQIGSLDRAEVSALFAPAEPTDGRAGEPAAWLAGYRRRISFTGARSPEFRRRWLALPGAVVEPFPSTEDPRHASHRLLQAALADPTLFAPPPRLRLDGSLPARAGQRLDGRRGPRLAIHPGSGASRKRAPGAVFRTAAAAWVAHTGGEAVAVLGPAEEDAAGEWALGGLPALRPEGVAELAAVLASAAAYLGNDSGPSHVAAAVGTPAGAVCFTATLPCSFGPRSPAFWAIGVPDEPVSWEPLGREIGLRLARSVARSTPGGPHPRRPGG